MKHTPSAKLLDKERTASFRERPDCEDPHWYERQLLETWVTIRTASLFDMLTKELPKLKKQHSLSTDEIIIGGVIQSLVTLCAYTNTYQTDRLTGEIRLPDSMLQLIMLSMTYWTPRVFVFVDAEKSVRKERVDKSGEIDPFEVLKRKLPFDFDDTLRKLTVNTLRYIELYGQSHNVPFNFVYYPTSGGVAPKLIGSTIFTPSSLCAYIYSHQNHRELHHYWSRITDCWGDETDFGFCEY